MSERHALDLAPRTAAQLIELAVLQLADNGGSAANGPKPVHCTAAPISLGCPSTVFPLLLGVTPPCSPTMNAVQPVALRCSTQFITKSR